MSTNTRVHRWPRRTAPVVLSSGTVRTRLCEVDRHPILAEHPAVRQFDADARALADHAGRAKAGCGGRRRTSGQMLAARDAAGHEALVKPWPISPAVPGGFTVDDFTVNVEAGTVSCPNGVTRPINRARQVNFGVACRGCPLRARCTRSATGKAMRIREHDALQRAHRTRALDPDFHVRYRQHRPMVERSLAEPAETAGTFGRCRARSAAARPSST